MENISLLDSFSEFKDEKLIDRVTLMVILEEVFRNTLTRKIWYRMKISTLLLILIKVILKYGEIESL
jgi:hypothetical protein